MAIIIIYNHSGIDFIFMLRNKFLKFLVIFHKNIIQKSLLILFLRIF
jgi:hypothetical protein